MRVVGVSRNFLGSFIVDPLTQGLSNQGSPNFKKGQQFFNLRKSILNERVKKARQNKEFSMVISHFDGRKVSRRSRDFQEQVCGSPGKSLRTPALTLKDDPSADFCFSGQINITTVNLLKIRINIRNALFPLKHPLSMPVILNKRVIENSIAH